MNKATRKQLSALQADLNAQNVALVNLREALEERATDAALLTPEQLAILENVGGVLSDVQSSVSDLCGDEEEKFDTMPEGLQSSDRGVEMEAAKDALSEASDSLEALCSTLSDDFEATTTHEEAVEALKLAEDELTEIFDKLDEAAA